MKIKFLVVALCSMLATTASAGMFDDLKNAKGGDLAGQVKAKAAATGNQKIAAQVNKKLLVEARKNQCSFNSGTDELAAGCDGKAKRLAKIIVDVKKSLQAQGQTGFKFIVSGHTDSTGDAAKNKELSQRRAQVMVKQLVANGVNDGDIDAVGMGSEKLLVKPDTTAAQKAKNRRYEVQVRF